LKHKYDEPLSRFAFNINLRRYNLVAGKRYLTEMRHAEGSGADVMSMILLAPTPAVLRTNTTRGGFNRLREHQVGRCWLTISKPELKPRLVSVSAISA